MKDIFNLSLQTGVFPKSLKNVRVVPVYKSKGSQNDVSNYRPISLLSNMDKVFEKLVYSRVIFFFKQIIYYSTAHSLINITERIRQSLDKGEYSCGILIDFKKAFDTVDHLMLLKKLDHY